jgi:hypothetical protein
MALTLRPTGGHSPVYANRHYWTIFDGGKPVGRIYENASASTPVDLRWFWSITVYVDPMAGIVTSGKVTALEEAKAEFEAVWRRWLAASPTEWGV